MSKTLYMLLALASALDYKTLYFDDPEPSPDPDPDPDPADDEEDTHAYVGAKDIAPEVSIDVVSRLAADFKVFLKALGYSDFREVPRGSVVNVYKTVCGELAEQVGEGQEITPTPVQRVLVKAIPIVLNKYLKLVTDEAMLAHGDELALEETDEALVEEIVASIKTKFFSILADAEGVADAGADLQEACSNALTACDEANENKAYEPLFFISRKDLGTYHGTAPISVQKTLGVKYLADFIGMEDFIVSAEIPKGKVYVTPKTNIGAVVPAGGADIATRRGMTTDSTGMILMKHFDKDDHASMGSLIETGATFYIKDLANVFVANIGE